MFYFLAIVLKNNVKKGEIIADYRLYKNNRTNNLCFLPQSDVEDRFTTIFFRNFVDHENLIRSLPTIRTYDHTRPRVNSKFGPYFQVKPVGSYFWMPCDKYGEEVAGTKYYIGDISNLFYDDIPSENEKVPVVRLMSDLTIDKSYTSARFLNIIPESIKQTAPWYSSLEHKEATE